MAIEPLAFWRESRISVWGFEESAGCFGRAESVNPEAGVDEVDAAAGLQDDTLSILLCFATQNCKHSAFRNQTFQNIEELLHLKQSKFCLQLRCHQPANLQYLDCLCRRKFLPSPIERCTSMGKFPPLSLIANVGILRKYTRMLKPSPPLRNVLELTAEAFALDTTKSKVFTENLEKWSRCCNLAQ